MYQKISRKKLVATDSSLQNTEIKHPANVSRSTTQENSKVLKVLKLKVLKSDYACLEVCKVNQGFRWFLSVSKVFV